MSRIAAIYDPDDTRIKHPHIWDHLIKMTNINDRSKSQSQSKSNKRKRCDDYNNEEYVSGTQIKNFLLKDPLLDWLDLYYKQCGLNNYIVTRSKKQKFSSATNSGTEDLQIFFDGGNEFEEKINTHLNRLFKDEIITINNDGRDGVTLENFEKTKRAMLDGIPVILQGVIYNTNNKTRGVTDILIRSDYINRLVKNKVVSRQAETIKADNLPGNYHYRVIDIKWTSMTLCANGYNIRNDARFPAYKGQLAIYNSILGHIQGYVPPVAYIMAKAWKIDSKKNPTVGFSCFDLLGVIDYDGFDSQYVKKTTDAISWLHDVKAHGAQWSPLNPTRSEMYPNASNKLDTPWTNVKKHICNEIDEITQIWYVSDTHRNNAHSQGIMKWSDPRCNSNTLGITGDVKPNTIDEILDINRDPSGTISPEIIVNNLMNWQVSSPVDFYVDFETINTCFLETNVDLQNSKVDHDIIFEIGVGYITNGAWNFVKFVANNPSLSEENRIITEYTTFITNHSKILDPIGEYVPRLFHWSYAEESNMLHANYRHNDKWKDWAKSVLYTDMYYVFNHEPIVVKGALNFRLKSIGKAMYSLGLVKTKWDDSGPSDGLDAMMSAIKLYKSTANSTVDITEFKPMIEIIKYNEIDCKIIWEIVQYLREHHTDVGRYEYNLNVYE